MSTEAMQDDDAIYKEIREIFFLEAATLLKRFEGNAMLLDAGNHDAGVIENLFRDAHTIKGSAASVQMSELASYVHHLEDLLSKLKRTEIPITRAVGPILFEALDVIRGALEMTRRDEPIELPIASLIASIGNVTADGPCPGTRDIGAAPCDALHAGLRTPNAAPSAAQAHGRSIEDDYVSIPLNKIETILNHFGEQVILQSALEHLYGDVRANEERMRRTVRQLSKITLMLQDSVLALRMVSVRPIFQKTTRALRDASRALGKDVQLVTAGEDIELDKSLADKLAGPVTHIIRNAVDHGVEMPEDRVACGKPKRGTIHMEASYNGGFFQLQIRDDGKGIDRTRVLSKAIAQGIVPPDQTLTDEEVCALIFQPGFSTKDVATEISGRGFGMDIVRKEIMDLRGTVAIRSKAGEGSVFTIQLPMTVAIFNGMIVNAGGTLCIVPNSDVGEVYSARDLKRVDIPSGPALVEVANAIMPIVPLARVTRFADKITDQRKGVVIVVKGNDKPYALHVDEVVGQQRVVMKNLGRELNEIVGISGGAILADGSVAFVLKVADILNQFEKGAAA